MVPVLLFGLQELGLRAHVDGFQARLGLVPGRADVHAQSAAGAILGSDLDGVSQPLPLGEAGCGGGEGSGSPFQGGRLVGLAPDRRVRADQDALAALNADARIPRGNLKGEVALLPLGGAGGISAVERQGAHGQRIAATGDHRAEDVAHEIRGVHRDGRLDVGLAGHGLAHLDFVQVGERGVNGGQVHLDDLFAFLAVGLADGLLDRLDGFLARKHSGDVEEADLHDRVDAPAHAGGVGHLVGVDHVELGFLVDQLLLQGSGQPVPNLVGAERRAEEEGAVVAEAVEHLVPVQERGLVAADEVGLGDQVAGADRARAEAQMGDGDGPGLLGVVDEVALGVVVGVLADDLDRLLVGADGAVASQAEEDGANDVIGLDGETIIVVEAGVGDVIVDAEGEVVLRFGLSEVVIHGLDHRRGEFLGGKPVPAADGLDVRAAFLEKGVHAIQIERLAICAGFLGAIEHRHRLDRLGQGIHEPGDVKRAEQADLQHADLLPLGDQVINRLMDGVAARAHQDDHAIRIGSAMVFIEVVLAAGEGGELVHGLLHQRRELVVVWIDRLAGLEIDVRVLGRAADHRAVRGEAAHPVLEDLLVADHAAENLIGKRLDLGHLVRSPEPVEEMHERDA